MAEAEKLTSYQLLTRDILEAALKKDLGHEWNLLNYVVKDFTKKGDNYACIVTSVRCTAVTNGNEKNVYYIAKLNPSCGSGINDDMTNEFFIREGMFLTDVAVKLNQILVDLNITPVHFPECVFLSVQKGQEVMITKDLRQHGFKMIDRKTSMGFDHTKLLVKEVARLHASSHIMKKRCKENILDLYPYMYDKWLVPGTKSRAEHEQFLKDSIDIALRLIKNLTGYEKQYQWLQNVKLNVMDIYCNLLTTSPDNLRFIIHGDCWSNNNLFRYSESGHPLEVTLLDLALCRFTSPGIDLNYIFYISLNDVDRRTWYDQFLNLYLEEFRTVLSAAKMEMPFTEEEFRNEVKAKALYGILSAITDMPMVICDKENTPDFYSITEENKDAFMKEYSDFIVDMLDNTPSFKPRFIALLEDLVDKDIID